MRSVLPSTQPFSFFVTVSILSISSGCGQESAELDTDRGQLLALAGSPVNIGAPDFNHDGFSDLAVTNTGTNNLAVRLNKGDGTFYDVVRYPAGLQAAFLATGDFNNDEHLDAAVVNFSSNNVSVFLGQGAGTLSGAQNYSISNPRGGLFGIAANAPELISEDFNHDGILDLATTNFATNNISVLLGNGDGTFQIAHTYPLLGLNSLGLVPFSLAAGDLDGDGNLDMVSGGGDSFVVLIGHGDGSFTAVRQYPVGFVVAFLRVEKFNGDGKLDVVATAFGSSNYAVYLGNGDATFTLKENKPSGGLVPNVFSVGDLNGDHILDIALVHSLPISATGDVTVLLGNGDGTFGAPVAYPIGITPWAPVIADFDGDGKLDVASCNGGNASVSVNFGNGDGTLRPEIMYPM